MEIHSVGAALIHVDRQEDRRTDGQTDMMRPTGTFRDYAILLMEFSMI
jgi:hypothetical protein